MDTEASETNDLASSETFCSVCRQPLRPGATVCRKCRLHKIMNKLTVVIFIILLALSVRYIPILMIFKEEPEMGALYPPPESEIIVPETSPYPRSSVDKMLDQMEFGTIAFNSPAKINIDDSPKIHLILSLAETVEKLQQAISEEGKKVGARIRVSNRMQARLSGYMFQITAITPEIQAVSKTRRTEWGWEIHPKKEGSFDLHLTLSALLKINGNDTLRAIRTFDTVIEVEVTGVQKIQIFFKNNWQWLWAAILVPIAGWIWRQKKKSSQSPTKAK